MRIPPHRNVASLADRRNELRKARMAAPVLRDAWPQASMVRVELAFDTSLPLGHAPQAFSIYPPARAHFVYACPFGDCDGMFDLNVIARDALQAGKRSVHGKLTCLGQRAREGQQSRGPCELDAKYTIDIRHDDAAAGGGRAAATARASELPA